MKNRILVLVLLPLLVLILAGTSYAWQGRMGGMGDPYGLVSDESDFLIHPAKIAGGEGVRFYGYYRFTYTDVMDWDYDLDLLTLFGSLSEYSYHDTSGDELKHKALVGAAFPLGPGRMGVFFEYAGMRGNYEGDKSYMEGGGVSYEYFDYDLMSAIDDFALRLLYGLPVGGFNLGGEIQFSYCQEENEEWLQEGFGTLNYPFFDHEESLFPLMLPYDSEYWKALLKGSLEGMVGPFDLEFTLQGGFIFSGGNELEHNRQSPIGNITDVFNLDGGVEGWQIGGDLWLRYPIDSLTFPFLVRVDYQAKTRDGDGAGYLGLAGSTFDYEHEERSLVIEVGGGVDKELAEGTRIAAGLYYGYLHNTMDFTLEESLVLVYDGSNYPAHTEHQVRLRLAGERAFSPIVSLRMGVDCFYGWVREDYEYYDSSPVTNNISLNGSRWGIGASLGGSVQLNSFTLEPFVNAGYQELNLDGDGERVSGGVITNLWEMDKIRREWYVGGGFSVLFDVP